MTEDPIDPKLLEDYLARCRAEIEKARETLALLPREKDPERVKRLRVFIHQLTGSGGSYGFPEAGETALKLERLLSPVLVGSRPADGGLLAQASALLDALQRELGV